jgi:hypothetical protein
LELEGIADMRCEEIREHFIDFVYDAGSDYPAATEAREHLRTCSACRRELEELRHTRKYLQIWKDEAPLRSLMIAGCDSSAPPKFKWKYLRYAAIAAMAVLCILALTNAQITWNKDGFSFSTRLFSAHEAEGNYYTKSEVRDIMKKALDDSESRVNETSYLMMQKMLDTIEQDRWRDLYLVRSSGIPTQNKN